MKRENGITLIALVITIIVLLILAGVSISLVVGNNGVLTRTTNAVEKNRETEAMEDVEMAWTSATSEYWRDYSKDSSKTLDTYRTKVKLDGYLIDKGNIEENPKFIETEKKYIIKYREKRQNKLYIFLISEDGKIVVPTIIKKDESQNYEKYYADIECDGIVDGVIYADLLIASSSTWGSTNYSIPDNVKINSNEVKDYFLSQEKYIGPFGENPVLSPIGSGKERFYVMSLNNFFNGNYNSFYWYKNGYDGSSGYMNSSKTKKEFGKGYSNTANIIELWNNDNDNDSSTIGFGVETDEQDIWANIQEEFDNGWFIPSHGEWGKFAGLYNFSKTRGDQNYFGNSSLSGRYWCSSLRDSSVAFDPRLESGGIDANRVNNSYAIRLSITF